MEARKLDRQPEPMASNVTAQLRNMAVQLRPVAICLLRGLPLAALALLSSFGSIWMVFMLLG